MIGQRTKRKVKSLWKTTRNRDLEVRWEQEPLREPGIGVLTARILCTGKTYRLRAVPSRVYRKLMHEPAPELLMNQLLTIYVVDADSERG